MADTDVAVGCAVGIPCGIVLIVMLALWFRQKLRYKREVAAETDRDKEINNDLDLDDVIDANTIRDNKKKHESNDSWKIDVENQTQTAGETSSSSGDTDEKLVNKTYLIRKQSKIMGLKIVPNTPGAVGGATNGSSSVSNDSKGSLQQPQYPHNRQSRTSKMYDPNYSGSNQNLAETSITVPTSSTAQRQNYMNYYESVIPVLPSASGSTHSILNGNTAASNAGTDTESKVSDIPTRKSQNSLLGGDYVQQLRANDSSSFPRTTQTLVPASPSQINLMNNYSASASTSRNGSSLNLYNAGGNAAGAGASNLQNVRKPRHHRDSSYSNGDLLSNRSRSRGSNQSLLMLGAVAGSPLPNAGGQSNSYDTKRSSFLEKNSLENNEAIIPSRLDTTRRTSFSEKQQKPSPISIPSSVEHHQPHQQQQQHHQSKIVKSQKIKKFDPPTPPPQRSSRSPRSTPPPPPPSKSIAGSPSQPHHHESPRKLDQNNNNNNNSLISPTSESSGDGDPLEIDITHKIPMKTPFKPESKPKTPTSKSDTKFETPPALSSTPPIARTISPFDTPPRESQYFDDEEEDEDTEISNVAAPVSSLRNANFGSHNVSLSTIDPDEDAYHDAVDASGLGVKSQGKGVVDEGVQLKEEEKDMYANYKSNKKEWLSSVVSRGAVH
ncbi:unnamed protein product [Ambrosiozyma monospora]|uniref:Unnamed protein product n=1 Tax=Ambrosiozyma monospora TaxID=43982 RepID=A0A9W6YXB8_AMBMO|nr:unnamed protein product [Ambrosiozyma monospora]